MPNQLDAFHSFSSKQNSLLFVIVLVVIALHLLLLGLGTFWQPAAPAPKPRSKVIVQTVRLKPIQSETAQSLASVPATIPNPVVQPLSFPIEQPKAELSILPPAKEKEVLLPEPESIVQKEETLIPKPDPVVQKEELSPLKPDPIMPKEEVLSTQEIPTPKEIPIIKEEPEPALIPVTPSLSIPAKVESKPQPKLLPPKPVQKEMPKKDSKPAAPIKKAAESTKKNPKNESAKSKQAEEAEKKRQQEQAEKKRQQDVAEKKRQQEVAEMEKKRQQEIAEIERKRQQEIAVAQEAARQKEQALLTKAKENLAKMSETRDKISTSPSVSLNSTTIPKEIASLHVDALPLGGSEGSGDWGTKEASYSDEIAYRLKMALKLPDYGAVKIKLILDRTGKVIKVEIMKSESNKNKAYVESKIPTLLFPSFGQKFQGQSQYTFEFLLQNDS